MTLTSTPLRRPGSARVNSLPSAVWAEWVKLRTVRGWMIALALGAAAMLALCYLVANGPSSGTVGIRPIVPTGPAGETVADTYEFVHRTLTSDGTITARITSLTGVTATSGANVQAGVSSSRPGLAPWAKAGLMITPSTRQGSAYAAVMATGSHGIRFQYDYTHDTAAPLQANSTSTPRWMRLVRSGETITAYTSTTGQRWSTLGSARLSEMPSSVQVGLFVTSPNDYRSGTAHATLATASFDQVKVDRVPVAARSWSAQDVGTGPTGFYPTLAGGSYHNSGSSIVVSGSGDIAPAVVAGQLSGFTASSSLRLGLIVGMLVVIVLAAMFVTSEYRHGLIRTTFAAVPDRGRVLLAKGLVVGAPTFALSAVVMTVAVPLGQHLLRSHGNYVASASSATELRIIVGASALVAFTAVIAIALSAIVRRPAAAITAGVGLLLLPYIAASAAGGATAVWLLRLTPAAGMSMLQGLTRYHQVSYAYTPANGYYPLSPLAGFAVLITYALLALTAATVLLNRRDA